MWVPFWKFLQVIAIPVFGFLLWEALLNRDFRNKGGRWSAEQQHIFEEKLDSKLELKADKKNVPPPIVTTSLHRIESAVQKNTGKLTDLGEDMAAIKVKLDVD